MSTHRIKRTSPLERRRELGERPQTWWIKGKMRVQCHCTAWRSIQSGQTRCRAVTLTTMSAFAPLSRPSQSQVKLDQTPNRPQTDGFTVCSGFSPPTSIADLRVQVSNFSSFEQASTRNSVSGPPGAVQCSQGPYHSEHKWWMVCCNDIQW